MRYFTGPSSVFDAMRSHVMDVLGQPNPHALEPWPAGITKLALAPHEYEPPHYAALVALALQSGITEITEAEYHSLLPEPSE